MSSPRLSLTVESALYLAFALLALAVRLDGLGVQPLSDAEAHDALAAFRFVNGRAPQPGVEPSDQPASPLLFGLSALAFLICGASNTTARLAPALAGSALVLTPIYFRRQVGRAAALVMSGLLASSPTLIAASRTADSAMLLALAAAVLVGSWLEHRETGAPRPLYLAAVSLGAALAGGSRAITVLAIFGIVFLLWRVMSREAGPLVRRSPEISGLTPAGLVLGAFAVSASAMFLYRPGIAAAAQALPQWIAGWMPSATTRNPLHVPVMLAVYEPLILIFGLAGAGRVVWRWNNSPSALRPWLFAAVAALFAAIVYTGRTSEDTVWIVYALAALAASWVVELLRQDWSEIDAAAMVAHVALIVVLLIYAGLNLASFAEASRTFNAQVQSIRLALAATACLLVVIVSLLFGVGWSAAGAARAVAIGVGIVAALAGVSSARHLTQWGEDYERARELWAAGASTPVNGLPLLIATLEGVSDRAVGAPHDIQLAVNAPPRGALAWALRDFGAARYTDLLAATITTPVVIAPAEISTPELGSAYVGQSFAVRARLDAGGLGLAEWVEWLIFRRAPLVHEDVILWVRADVQFRTGSVTSDQ